jgi:DNA-damage-inducible protein J
MTDTTMLHVRIDRKTKDEANETLEHLGLSMSDAIRLFLHRVAADQAFPLELKVPNAATRAAMIEARAHAKARFGSADCLFHALDRQEG